MDYKLKVSTSTGCARKSWRGIYGSAEYTNKENIKVKKQMMICQPMFGKMESELEDARKTAIKFSESANYNVCNSYCSLTVDESKGINAGLFYLAHSLDVMSKCDLVYFVKGWETAKGCRLEYEAARAYGMAIMIEKN